MPTKTTDYRLFGRTGVKISPLTLGAMNFGRRTELEDSVRIIDTALDAGINIIDTANVYSRGRSEEIVGEALTRNGKRSRVFLATKVHGAMDETDPNAQGNSRRHIIEQAEASLRRLKTDHIDLYQIHRPRPEIAIDETLRALDDLVRSGKVRYIGTTTFASWQIVEALWASDRLHLNRFVSEQPPYNLLDRRIERELLPAAQTFGLGVIPWSPIGGGLLTGKYKRDQTPPADARFHPDNRPGPASGRPRNAPNAWSMGFTTWSSRCRRSPTRRVFPSPNSPSPGSSSNPASPAPSSAPAPSNNSRTPSKPSTSTSPPTTASASTRSSLPAPTYRPSTRRNTAPPGIAGKPTLRHRFGARIRRGK